MKILIAGAGIFGATCTRVLTEAGHECVVVEARQHVAGNVYTRWSDEAGCNVHKYGAHIFHTKRPDVWAFVNRFADFSRYTHRVKAWAEDAVYPLPINLATISRLWDADTPSQMQAVLDYHARGADEPTNMRDACIAKMGPELFRLFVAGYTRKQWGRDAADLPASLADRVKVRTTFDDQYFDDPYQGIPRSGYTPLIRRMLECAVTRLGFKVDFEAAHAALTTGYDRIIYTGAIDEFFGYRLGALEYRSLRFEHDVVDVDDYQGCAVMNYCDADVPYTRIIEHKHFDGAPVTGRTIITREFPQAWEPGRDRFYPIGDKANESLAAEYRAHAALACPRVLFGGRLGSYRYLDMDAAVAAAFELCATIPRGT